ncbi:NADP-dependent isocitrate dehydrogenase [Paracoccus sp. TK19116]|uniref:isocitrate dehydrogenase (NADP(+)) n=1 Tax=Paracoccus albicereus TaxID=2922394 RepID=A0ABT1MMW8_9RHOB|nr:NADP-dependent isocitrate dehydrogenase [Paracoccus albicereus]MCQ0969605.1 NADP-dependent isocitrate dehydrogenase [Paracoccus albicereus]
MDDPKSVDIIYTKVDEAPELASASFLPIIRSFAGAAGLNVATRDISLAGRIIAAFSDRLTDAQKQDDDLAIMGQLVKKPDANVIKLPNISASVPQLVAAVKELQAQGYDIPDYVDNPSTDEERANRAKFDAVKGSAVNPVLREGNSDRRAAKAVKSYAQNHPHSMGTWSADSKTRVLTMGHDDFRSNEVSTIVTAEQAGPAKIELKTDSGNTITLKEGYALKEGSVVDTTFMSVRALQAFLKDAIEKTKADGTLFSLHLKATMMKVSDPILFGHAVRAYLAPVFEKHGDAMAAAGADPNLGLGTMLDRLGSDQAILDEIKAVLNERPPLYMVNSDKGITNLHVPSDVIIDASMPSIIRGGGKGWGPDGKEADTTCVIPDSSYADVYEQAIEDMKANGALNPATAGTVQNIGLMAQKAEEYGSHPTTFEIPEAGTVRLIAANGDELSSHKVEAGDIWRSASTTRAAIEDWIKLAISRQKAEGCEAIFWLNADRAHDAQLLTMVRPALEQAGAADRFQIMAPGAATTATFDTIRQGKTSIAVTGNVLRDYLTDLFPILELGTSAKMLSIVKLMDGGGLFETGAGGSAPKHVQQLVEQNHLRWDSLGEFTALSESLKFLADERNDPKILALAEGAEAATQAILEGELSPGRKVGQNDNRDSHFHFALNWAKALSEQDRSPELAEHFSQVYAALSENRETIERELKEGRGQAVDLGGYYHTDPAKTAKVMRPSATLNEIIG